MFACTNTCFCAQTPANLSKNRSNVVQNRSKSLKITRKLFETARNCLKWLNDRSQPPPPPPPPLPTVSTVYEQCTNTSIPVSTPSVLTPPFMSQHVPLFQDSCTNVNPGPLGDQRSRRAVRGSEGALEAPSDGLKRRRRGRLTGRALPSTRARKPVRGGEEPSLIGYRS